MRRLLIILSIVVLGGAVFAWSFSYVLTLYRTAYVVSHVIPQVPEWFEWGSYEFERREVFLGDRDDRVDLYLPQGLEQASFVILFPGFTPEGSRDARVRNLARSFAGAGVGVAVPDSSHIRQREFSRDDVDFLADSFSFLQGEPYVRADRIGLSGFSIAGSYALRAASELGSEPLFVHSLGAYYDLAELLEVFRGQEEELDPGVRDLVRQVIAEREEEEIVRVSQAISPSVALQNMRTRVFLMHDRNDNIIPVEESRKIRDALPPGISVSYSEFGGFEHVTPQNLVSFDILKLSAQILQLMRLLLSSS